MSEFNVNMFVEYIDSMGDDNSICQAARVSTGSDVVGYKESKGLINYLWREGHTSPFEHVTFTFRIGVPIFIARQIQRHRTFSFNEISGRYSELDTVFWMPSASRPLKNEGSGAYPKLVHHKDHDDMHSETFRNILDSCADAEMVYNNLLDMGVATEVARSVLPLNTYTWLYMTGNLKNFLDFIDKRTVDNAQYEVKEVAWEMLEGIRSVVPLAVEAWENN